MKKVISISLTILLVIFLLINLVMMITGSFMGIRVFKISSGSMEPVFKINSLILVKEDNNYNIGDVITFDDDGSYVTHRIVSTSDKEIVTRGDANNTDDKPIDKKSVIGKVICTIPFSEHLSNIFSKPFIYIFVSICIITLLIFQFKK